MSERAIIKDPMETHPVWKICVPFKPNLFKGPSQRDEVWTLIMLVRSTFNL